MSKKCPICNCALQLSEPIEINHLVVCSNCGAELEVVWLYPLEFVKVTNPNLNPNPNPNKIRGNKFKKRP